MGFPATGSRKDLITGDNASVPSCLLKPHHPLTDIVKYSLALSNPVFLRVSGEVQKTSKGAHVAVGLMPLKKIDNRVRTLVENGVSLRYRSLFVVVGDRGRDQVSECGSKLARRCHLQPFMHSLLLCCHEIDNSVLQNNTSQPASFFKKSCLLNSKPGGPINLE